MALLDFVKEMQLMANQGTPYGEALMQREQLQNKQRVIQEQQQREAMAAQQRGQALASALPEQLQGFAGLVQATGDIDAAIDLYKAQQAPAGKLTFDAFGNPIQVVIGANGMPVAQKIGGLEYQGGGMRDLSQSLAQLMGQQQQPESAPLTLDTPLGMEPAIDPQTDAIMRKDYSQQEAPAQQPAAPDYDAQIDRLMKIRAGVAFGDVTKAKQAQRQVVLSQIDRQIDRLEKDKKEFISQAKPTIAGGEQNSLITGYQFVRDARKTIQQTIDDVRKNPTDAGIVGKAKGVLQTVMGAAGDVAREVPGLDPVVNSLPSIGKSESGYVSRFQPIESTLSSGLAAARAVGRPTAALIEAASKDVSVTGLQSSEQVIERLLQLDEQLNVGEKAFKERAKQFNLQLPEGNATEKKAESARPKFKEGQTATNPSGQKIIFRNGNWEPM